VLIGVNLRLNTPENPCQKTWPKTVSELFSLETLRSKSTQKAAKTVKKPSKSAQKYEKVPIFIIL
jgi:hypothetical protein